MKFIINFASTGEINAIRVKSKGTPSNMAQHVMARMIRGIIEDLFGNDDAKRASIIDAISDSNPVKPLAIVYSKVLRTPDEDITDELQAQFGAAMELDLSTMIQEAVTKSKVCDETN